MKRKQTKRTYLMMLLLLCGVLLGGSKVYAAETQFYPTTDKVSAPVLGINNDGYYAVTNGLGYASFVTPSQGGYIEVEYKNISISGWAYAGVYTAIDEKLARTDRRSGGSAIFRFRSEQGKRNDSQLEPNTKYYIQVGKTDCPGNVKIVIRFRPDNNPDGKEQAEEIRLNQEYTRSIDGYVGSDKDNDYFKFTATKSGAHHFTINNACSGWLNYCVRKWNSDEYVKKTNGYDMKDDTYSGNTAEYDIVLEAGQTYYLDVWHDNIGNYTFSFSDQCVQSINMPAASITLNYGENYTLNPTVTPKGAYNKTLNFSSDNSDIAYVDKTTGLISAEKPGKAIITATATDGSNTTAQCVVYVTPDKPSAPYCGKTTNTSIQLNWYSVYGADGYIVYLKSGNNWKAIKDTNSTSYNVKKLKAGSKYQFRIKAYVNADGKKYSLNSDIVKLATSPKKTSITKISKLKKKSSAYGAYYRAKIKWKKVSGATSYKLYYRASGSSYKYLYKEYKGTSATVQFYKSKYSNTSLKYTFYVVPVKKYEGKSYTGSYSKGKTYKFK